MVANTYNFVEIMKEMREMGMIPADVDEDNEEEENGDENGYDDIINNQIGNSSGVDYNNTEKSVFT